MSAAAVFFVVIAVWALLIWAGIAWVHYLADDRGPLDKEGLVGVRGWLTVLVGGLIGWGPLIRVGGVFQEFSKAESLYPAITGLSEWQTYTSIMWFLVLVLTAWQIHVGWKMCRERVPSVVDYLKKFLWFSPVFYLLMGLPNVLVLEAEYPVAEMFGGAIGFAIVNGIWLWYLSKSKRIARTYNVERVGVTVGAPSLSTSMAPEAMKPPIVRGGLSEIYSTAGSHHGATVQVSESSLSPASSVEEKISRHRLERALGTSLDEGLYAKCLAECDLDHLRATALYQRLKAGLDKH
jgi:hypothetical protein